MGVDVEPLRMEGRSGDDGGFEPDLSALLILAPRIRNLFKDYLRISGFPLSINGDLRVGGQLIRSLEGEILRTGRSLDIARGVISSLSISHRTVREYVELLAGLMVLEKPSSSMKHRSSGGKEGVRERPLPGQGPVHMDCNRIPEVGVLRVGRPGA